MDSQEIIGLLKEISEKLDRLIVLQDKSQTGMWSFCRKCGMWYFGGMHFCNTGCAGELVK